jgi:hypothetical protein
VPRVFLRPDERAQRWLLSISASDRSGLLYAVAACWRGHHINLQLAKVSTLGERVEDTFLVDGAALQNNRLQIQVETEVLDAISAPEEFAEADQRPPARSIASSPCVVDLLGEKPWTSAFPPPLVALAAGGAGFGNDITVTAPPSTASSRWPARHGRSR